MAFSSERKARAVQGGLITEVYSFNAAGVTSGTVYTGLGTILHVSVNNEVTEGQGLAVPTSSGGMGSIALSSVVSNDTGTLLVVGY